MLHMCQVSTSCELLVYIYLMNGLFICYMLWARGVTNILEYQWRIQDGAFGANAHPSRNCIQDRDTLIEQSITLIKQSQC